MAFCWREDQKLVNHGSRSSVLKYWMLRLGMGWDDGGEIVDFEGCSVDGETYSGNIGGLVGLLLMRLL